MEFCLIRQEYSTAENMVGMWLIIMDDYCLVWAGLPMAYEFQMGSLRLYAFTCGYQMHPLQIWDDHELGIPNNQPYHCFQRTRVISCLLCDFHFLRFFGE
jgi:hypothetical protein